MKKPDQLADVKTCDEFRRERAPVCKLRYMIGSEVVNALRPVERLFQSFECLWHGNTGKADVFAAGVGVRNAPMLGQEIDRVALTATSEAFPTLFAIMAWVDAEACRRILVKRTTRRFFHPFAEPQLRHERGERQALFGLSQQVLVHGAPPS